MALTQADYATIRSLIQAYATAPPAPTPGLLRPGTVSTYDSGTQQTGVVVDGDLAPTMTLNITGFHMPVGQRVMVSFQPPHGAFVVGLAQPHPAATLDIQTGTTTFPVSGTSTGATVPVTFDRPFAEGPWIAGAVSTNTGTQGNLGIFTAPGVTSTGFTARLVKVRTDLTFSSDIGVRWIAVGRAAS